MSDFSCPLLQVTSVENHPGADRLSIVKLDNMDFICIANKLEDGSPRYKVGDNLIYIPEGAVVPAWIMKQFGYWDEEKNRGGLSGSNHNVVKAKKLRGIFSQGLIIPVGFDPENQDGNYWIYNLDANETWFFSLGDDVSEKLGIVKYEPPIPENLRGETGALYGYTKSYDFDNVKKHPNEFYDDEIVIVTEKLHGTYVQIGFCSDIESREDLFGDGRTFITSKGLAKSGFYIKNVDANYNNLYVKTLRDSGIIANFNRVCMSFLEEEMERGVNTKFRIYLMGEIFGDVQDLKYGTKQGQQMFRAFDIFALGQDDKGLESGYFDYDTFVSACEKEGNFQVETVPELCRDYWANVKPRLHELTHGTSAFDPNQIKEGVVIRPLIERNDRRGNRVIYKSVSEDYLLRKNKNATEFN